MKDVIFEKLKNNKNISYIEVLDESHLHIGHVGNLDGKGNTHFKLIVRLNSNISSVEFHRIVNKELEEEFKSKLHSLSIKILK